ncbi:hypothetical protein VNO80_01087 [Phaseolus coccineus]|uniref:Uncharacterized protein n=1 Tax=Phaseolus coccineus TaxID=3886 RepID=A0AAN9P4I3_PHACN
MSVRWWQKARSSTRERSKLLEGYMRSLCLRGLQSGVVMVLRELYRSTTPIDRGNFDVEKSLYKGKLILVEEIPDNEEESPSLGANDGSNGVVNTKGVIYLE